MELFLSDYLQRAAQLRGKAFFLYWQALCIQLTAVVVTIASFRIDCAAHLHKHFFHCFSPGQKWPPLPSYSDDESFN